MNANLCEDISAPPANSRAEQELFWQHRELTAFHRISEVMLSGRAEHFIFDTIARETSGMTNFPMVAIELCDFERAVMVYRGAHGIPLDEMPQPFEVPMDITLSGQVAYSGEVLIEHNIAARREYAAPILRLLGVKTFVCVPIKSDGRVIGTLSLSHREKLDVPERVIKAATSLANYLATLFDRFHAREVVSRSEAELATVYDRVPTVLCLFDDHLQVVRANSSAREFSGLHARKKLPAGLDEFFVCLATDAKKGTCGHESNCLGCFLRSALQATLTTRHYLRQSKVTKQINQDGKIVEVVVLVSTERIQLSGNTRVLLCLEDITKNVRADEQIRAQAALLDITHDAIFVRDFSDRILFWNQGAQKLYGWASSEAVGKTTNELLPGPDPFEMARSLHAVQHAGEWVGEVRQKSRDGRELVIQSRWTLMRESDGKPRSILIVNTDITEKKRLESQLLRSQRLESIGNLASGLAHDLNNVLAPIMMAVQFIKDNTEDEGMKACFETMDTCSKRGADIVRQVLMFARGVEGERVNMNPKHLISEMQRIASETFPRGIEIKTQIAPKPCVIHADATQVQQVIMNLCVNARDAMPNGGTLTIGLDQTSLDAAGAKIHPKAKPGDYVIISVSDTGSGIPPELMDKIFDPFFTTKPLGKGTGLGLPTVLGIAEKHGGFINLESKLGVGTTFSIYIPASKRDAELANIGANKSTVARGNGELVLVVDDEPAVRKLTSAILNRNGYRSLIAGDGREGREVFQRHKDEIRLLVSDLMMPQVDGPTMLRGLREISPGLKAIIITGLGEENRIGEAKAAGADAILNKPFNAEQLLLQVKNLLTQKTAA